MQRFNDCDSLRGGAVGELWIYDGFKMDTEVRVDSYSGAFGHRIGKRRFQFQGRANFARNKKPYGTA